MINDIMRRFETTQDEAVNQLLSGMDEWTLELALDDTKFQRMQRFHDAIYESEPTKVELEEGYALYEEPCFSALSVGGVLLGARHRQTTAGERTDPRHHYAFVTGSLDSDEMSDWRVVPWRTVGREDELEMTIDQPMAVSNLNVMGEGVSAHDRALLEVRRQQERERLRLSTTRVLLGRQAWKLLRAGYVEEPLQSTYGLKTGVTYARERGFTPRAALTEAVESEVDLIDIYS